MADEVSEQIAQAIFTEVATVTTGNGYTVTLIPNRPTGKDGYTPQDLLAIVEQEDPTENEELNVAGSPNAQGWKTVYTVDVWRAVDESSEVPLDKLLANAWADVVKAVMADDSHGGLAILTTPQARQTIYWEGGAFEGVSCPFEVDFRTNENDPTIAR